MAEGYRPFKLHFYLFHGRLCQRCCSDIPAQRRVLQLRMGFMFEAFPEHSVIGTDPYFVGECLHYELDG